MPAIKAGVMMSISLVQLANTRSLVQSYLNSGLRQWHSMKHGPQGRAAASGTATGALIKQKLMIVNGLFVKVRTAKLKTFLKRSFQGRLRAFVKRVVDSNMLMAVMHPQHSLAAPFVCLACTLTATVVSLCCPSIINYWLLNLQV